MYLFLRQATVSIFDKFSATLHYNNDVVLPVDTKSIVQTHTFCTVLVDKNIQKRIFYNGIVVMEAESSWGYRPLAERLQRCWRKDQSGLQIKTHS